MEFTTHEFISIDASSDLNFLKQTKYIARFRWKHTDQYCKKLVLMFQPILVMFYISFVSIITRFIDGLIMIQYGVLESY